MRDLVRKARTIRRFDQSNPINQEDLLTLVDMARISSCGGNIQPLRNRIVFEKDQCDAIFSHVAWAGALKDWAGPAEGEMPTGYIVILAEGNPAMDAGIAAQTIQLAAAAAGIGVCMMGSINRDEIKAILNLPNRYNIMLLIALGRPRETVVLEEVPAGSDLAYYRTPDGIHHVPKLALDAVLIE